MEEEEVQKVQEEEVKEEEEEVKKVKEEVVVLNGLETSSVCFFSARAFRSSSLSRIIIVKFKQTYILMKERLRLTEKPHCDEDHNNNHYDDYDLYHNNHLVASIPFAIFSSSISSFNRAQSAWQ